MSNPSLKKVANAILDQSVWAATDDLFPTAFEASAGPLKKAGKGYTYDLEVQLPRGRPKAYRVTVENLESKGRPKW